MESISVRVIASGSDAPNATQYQSNTGEPRMLAFQEPGDAAGGTLYDGILDLPDGAGGVPRARYIFIVGIELEAGHEDEFEEWYNVEHLPALAAVDGVRRAARYRSSDHSAAEGDGYPEYLAIYELDNADIAGNDDWKQAVNTPWTERMRPHFQAAWRAGYERLAVD